MARKQKRAELSEDGTTFSAAKDDDLRWYTAARGDDSTPGTAHARLFSKVQKLRNRQRPRREMYRFYAQLYGTTEFAGIGLTNYDAINSVFCAPTLPFNVVRRGIKTVVAKLARSKPLPMVLTSRGNYTQTKRARGITMAIEGLFEACGVFRKALVAARDACIFGPGIVKVYRVEGEGKPRVERVFPWELFADVADARSGEPRCIYQIKWYDRTVLKELFPTCAEAIEDASGESETADDVPDTDDASVDMVLVTEAWRLPDGPGKAGRHVIAVSSGTLVDEDYERNVFPFAKMDYDDPVLGYFGDSLASEMAGFQFEVNYGVDTLRQAHRVAATGIWMVPDGSDIPDAYFQNDVGMIIRHRAGFPPTYQSPPAANPQTYDWVQQCAKGSLEWGAGVSSMSANAQKPAGITAAKALTTLDDVESDNFGPLEQAFERFHVDIAMLLIDEMKAIAKDDPDAQILVPMRRTIVDVKWSDVDMDRDAIMMRVWPTNILGRTPAARIQTATDWFNSGAIDRNTYMRLVNVPDIDEETDLDAAARTICDEQIEKMLSADDPKGEGVYQRPGPYQDLSYAMHRAQQQINMGEMSGVPDANLELLRQYIQDAKSALDEANTPPPPPPGAPAPPSAPPGPMGQIGVAPPAVAPPAPVIGGSPR